MSIEIQHKLRQAGLKVTQARVQVMKVFSEQKQQITVKQIYQHLYQQDNKISLATVYRVINDLEITGLISQNQIGRGEAKYALPQYKDIKILELKCADLSCLDHESLIASLQNVFQQFDADLLDIQFKSAQQTDQREPL